MLNGEQPKDIALPKDSFVVCADGAYKWAKERGIRPDCAVGDFDSLGYVPQDCRVEKHPTNKDHTDGELALRLFRDKNCKKILVFGAFGKRTDHFLGNLALLGIGRELGLDVVLEGDGERIFLGGGEVSFDTRKNRTISLLPYGESVHIMNSKGLEYPLEDLILKRNETRGISNAAQSDKVEFFVKEGLALVIESWRER